MLFSFIYLSQILELAKRRSLSGDFIYLFMILVYDVLHLSLCDKAV